MFYICLFIIIIIVVVIVVKLISDLSYNMMVNVTVNYCNTCHHVYKCVTLFHTVEYVVIILTAT